MKINVSRGFTLIGSRIVVAIVDFFVCCVACLSRSHQEKQTGRGQGGSLYLANQQQAYLIDKRAYAPDMATLITSFANPPEIANDYDFATSAVNTASPPTFTVPPPLNRAQG